MVRGIFLRSAAAAALLAPMPVMAQRGAPPPAAPVYNWTGFYVGGTVGGGSFNNRWDDLGDSSNIPWFNGTSQQFGGSAAVLGAYVGYNWQVVRNLVLGIETDFTHNFGTIQSNWPGPAFGGEPRIDSGGGSQWTLRGRAGVTVDRVLLYVTGGVAVSDAYTRNVLANGTPTPFNFNATRTGYVVGGGVELMITPNWIVRAEGLFSDYGTQSILSTSGNSSGKTIRVKSTQTQGRVGLAYRF